jgi:preprotein translocase subunit SecG
MPTDPVGMAVMTITTLGLAGLMLLLGLALGIIISRPYTR